MVQWTSPGWTAPWSASRRGRCCGPQADEAQRPRVHRLRGRSWSSSSSPTSFQQAFDANYQGLTGSTRYNVDYSILGTSGDEPLMRDIRNAMYGAGPTVESSKGECNLGQHEIMFKYDQVLRTADNHVVFKAAAELARPARQGADLHGQVRRARGNSCHLHMSLRGTDGRSSSPTAAAKGGGTARRTAAWCSPASSRPGHAAGLHAALHRRSTPTSATSRGRSRPRPWVGRGQPDLRAAGGRARCGPRGEPGARRRRPHRPGRDARGRPARRPQRARARPAFVGNAYSADFARVPATLREASTGSPRPRWRRPRSARTSWRRSPAGRRGRAGGVRGGRDGLGAPAGFERF